MKYTNRAICNFLAAAALAGAADAQQFTPNRIFVGYGTGQNEAAQIVELNIHGGVVRTIPTPGHKMVYDLSFNATGRISVVFSSTNTLAEMDASGTLLSQTTVAGNLSEPTCALAAPNGNLYLINYYLHQLVEVDPSGALVRNTFLGAPWSGLYGGAVDPDGGIWLAANGARKIVKFDASGTPSISTTVHLPSGFAGPLTIAPDGHLFVYTSAGTDTFAIEEYDSRGTYLSSFDPGGYVYSLKFGPEGNLYIIQGSSIKVYDRQGQLDRTIALPAVQNSWPLSIAFSPFRFQAKVTGTAARTGANPVPVKEDVIIQYWPGSGNSSIQFTDDTANANDLASVLGTQFLQFHGFEIVKNATDKNRVCEGTQVAWPVARGGTASLSMLWNGNIGSHGEFISKKGRGSLHRSDTAAILDAILTITKSIP